MKNPPMLSDRLMYRLKRLQQALRSAMDRSLEHARVTGPQYAVLSALETAPGSSSAALARQCFVTAQTMDEIVRGLHEAGLIQREVPTHGRAVKLSVTRMGQQRLKEAHVRVRAVEEQALASLGSSGREPFLQLLDRCSAALEEEKQT